MPKQTEDLGDRPEKPAERPVGHRPPAVCDYCGLPVANDAAVRVTGMDGKARHRRCTEETP